MNATPSASQATSPRGRRADYVRFRSLPTRWMDNDVYGHINNVVYYSLFDTAVNAALIEEGLLDPRTSAHICLVIETGCRYHSAISFPETVEAGIRVARLGNSSIRYEIGLFRQGEQEAAADGHFVHVCVDSATRRPTSLPDPLRAYLAALVR